MVILSKDVKQLQVQAQTFWQGLEMIVGFTPWVHVWFCMGLLGENPVCDPQPPPLLGLFHSLHCIKRSSCYEHLRRITRIGLTKGLFKA